ncbi:MAG TPA: FtsX-like permease family protein [Actinomycetaceae bacterium]|nr:FtsX-like permease family protein [Actinomycetaceae bacterium]
MGTDPAGEPAEGAKQPRYQRRYRYRRGSPYWKSVGRSFEGTLSRWFAVFAIVALGTGVFAGLQSMEPDMYQSADRLYDNTNFMDLRVTSTMGLTEDDVQALERLDDVSEVQPQIITEGTIVLRDGVRNAAILSIDVESAERAQAGDADVVAINRPTVIEGRLPTRPDELLLSRSRPESAQIGDVVTIETLLGTEHPSEQLRFDEFTVVGFAESSYYLSGDVGQSPQTGAILTHFAYLPLQSFDDPGIFTDVLLTVDGALAETAFTGDYAAVVDPVVDDVKDIALEREQARFQQIQDDARQTVDEGQEELHARAAEAWAEIDDGQAELDRARAEAEQQLADAERAIDSGAAALTDAERRLASGQAEYDAGVREFAEQRRIVAAELAAGQQTIDEGRVAYEQGRATLAASEQELADGAAQLEAAETTLAEARAQLDQLQLALTALDTRTDLAAQAAELESRRAEAVSGLEAAESALAELSALRPAVVDGRDAAQAEVNQLTAAGVPDDDPLMLVAAAALERAELGLAELDAGIAEAEEGIAVATEGIGAIDEALPQLAAGIAAIDQELGAAGITPDQQPVLQEQAEAGETEYEAGRAALNEQVAAYEAGVQQFNAALGEAEDAFNELENGRRELDAARARAETEFTEAERQLAEAAAQLQTGRAELADGREQLAEGRRELADQRAGVQSRLEDGQRQLDEARETAEAEIRDAQKEIDEAYEVLADIAQPAWLVLGRNANPGFALYNANAERLASITAIFPYFFVLVAALVALTTMTRMVESERGEIGTMKALGHSQRRIMSKYLLFAGSAAGMGSIAGVLVGSKAFPTSIWNAYQVLYPNIELETPVQPEPALWSILVSVLGTMAVTAWAAWATLTEAPSDLMRPRAPAPGKRILLERVRPVWSRMTFSQKVTARNLFRYKKRMLMTLTGVAGCTGLLLTGFGINDNLRDFVEEQYGEIFTYNISILLDPDKDEGAAQAQADSGVARAVREDDSVSQAMFFGMQNAIAENPGGDPADIPFSSEGEARTGGSAAAEMRAARADHRNGESAATGGILRDVTLMVPADADRLDQFVQLTDAATREPLNLTRSEVVIPSRLAERLLIGPGDSFELSRALEDEPVTVTVSAVAHLYAGHYVFMGPETYADLFGEPPEFNYVLADVSGDDEARADQLQASLQAKSDAVLSVVDIEYTAKAYSDITSNLTSLVAVIVASSGMLAFVVLYNLTNINIEERRREIATIKVLGFRDKEVDAYVFRETAVLSVLGGLLGLPLGWALGTWVMRSAELDNVAFSRVIQLPSYAWAFGLTLVFTAVVMVFLRRKLRGIDMVGSLKSVE